MKVHWTDRAKQRLKLIHDHIAKDAPLVAPSVIERLVRRSLQIGEFPHSGRKVPEYQREEMREILEHPYRILYRIKSDRIDVITVMHYRQLLPDDLTQL
ncbi:MAG TPA: type II toxin-antitoxin system RelE/ParE family toxin [Acidiferrobacterales bacterium]|nr:type II toxin-antitoxin system RelE/ParE family toxin [Acidiferrobacterales bacterium]